MSTSASSSSPSKAAWLGLFAGVLAVSTGSVLVKLCTVPPLSLAAYRMGLIAPVFLLWTSLREPRWASSFRKADRKWVVLAGVSLGLHFATWIASLSYTSVTSSVVLVTTNPIFVGLGSLLFLKEPVTRKFWLGTALAILGTAVIAVSDGGGSAAAPDPALGNALALAGAFFMSGYLLVGRRLQSQVSSGAYITGVYSLAALTLWLGVLAVGSPAWGFSLHDWVLLALAAAIPQGVGHTMLNRSLKLFPATVVAAAILGEPVAATALATLTIGEQPQVLQVVGGMVVIAGVGLGTSKGRS